MERFQKFQICHGFAPFFCENPGPPRRNRGFKGKGQDKYRQKYAEETREACRRDVQKGQKMFETAFLFIVYAIIPNIPLILPAIIGAALCKTRGAAWVWYIVGVILRLVGIIGILVGMQRAPELYKTPENIFSIIAGVGIAVYYFWLIRKKNDSYV